MNGAAANRLVGLLAGLVLSLGALALMIGVVNVRDFVVRSDFFTLANPESAKPGIYDRARRILRADTLAASLIGVVALDALAVRSLTWESGNPRLYFMSGG